jgi:hypothetical protein
MKGCHRAANAGAKLTLINHRLLQELGYDHPRRDGGGIKALRLAYRIPEEVGLVANVGQIGPVAHP